MVPSGSSTPIGGAQSVSPSLLRSNSGMLGTQGNAVPSPMTFSNVVPPRPQVGGGLNVLANMLNASSELGQSFGNVGQNPAVAASGSSLHGGINSAAESDPMSSIGNGMGFNTPSSTLVPSNIVNPGTSGPVPGKQFSNPTGNQLMPDFSLTQPQPQSFDQQNFQQASQQSMQRIFNEVNTSQPSQQQFQSPHGGLAGIGPVKLEPHMGSDQVAQHPMRSLRNPGPVKLEPQQISNMRNLAPVKLELQNSDMSLLPQQQQQQQQVLHLQRQSPQGVAPINLMTQQRLLQLQQQQQLMKAIPQPRPQLPQQYQQQNLPLRSPARPAYEPGTCARRLTRFIYQQQRRPEDNNIEFWRKFVSEYFAPNAKKKWCVSMYGGRQATGVFPQEAWQCEICNRRPGRGFEATFEVLPRLFKIKYESGTLEELLYVDMPRERENSSGQIVLDYAKAIQESVFEQLRVVRDGQLRIVFSPDLKICSWEFCARRHEELIPRRLLIPQDLYNKCRLVS